jgi:hypothetical protein
MTAKRSSGSRATLFVGNKLWTGGTQMTGGKAFDLREIKAPIILFASMGDKHHAAAAGVSTGFAEVYGSTDRIKARGQVIVDSCIIMSGTWESCVRQGRERRSMRRIVSVLKIGRVAAAGLYAMAIHERKGRDGKVEYDVEFHERQLEDLVARLNRFDRKDEKPFEAVAAISEFNQRAYELFAQSGSPVAFERDDGEARAAVSIRCASSAGQSPI